MLGTFKEDWRRWWGAQTALGKSAPLLLCLAYAFLISILGELNLDHFSAWVPMLILYYGGPKTRPLFKFFMPLFLTGIVYDSQRYYADLIRGPIHVKEPYDFDLYFFGILEEGQRITPARWFQIHNHPILDLITGFFYIAFVPLFVLIAAYFQFGIGKTGTAKCSAAFVKDNAAQTMWAFFFLNVVGFSTYYWYAASPPWYADIYGFGPARIDVPANVAGCARFDQLLGTHIFDSWYGRAADVHGAIPSLHIAYPLVAFYYAVKFGSARVFSFLFYVAMCFSAVYLNQHYVLDVIIGSIYALAVSWTTDKVWNWRRERQTAFAATAQPSQAV